MTSLISVALIIVAPRESTPTPLPDARESARAAHPDCRRGPCCRPGRRTPPGGSGPRARRARPARPRAPARDLPRARRGPPGSAAPRCGRALAPGRGPRRPAPRRPPGPPAGDPFARAWRAARRSPARAPRPRARPRRRRRAAAVPGRRATAATGTRRGPGSPRTPRPRPRAPGQPAPCDPAPRPAKRAPSRSAWRSPRGPSRGAPFERAHGLRDDPPVVLVPQALPDQLLGDGGRQIAHLTPQLVARPPDVGLELDPRALDEAVGLGARGLDELSLLVGGLLPRRLPDGLRLGVGLAQLRHVLLQLSPGLRPPPLGLIERLLDGGRPLLHLRDERSVEELPEDEQENAELDHLDDQRHVEADDPAAALARGLRGKSARGPPEQRAGCERDAPPPPANAFTHAEVSCAGVRPVGL